MNSVVKYNALVTAGLWSRPAKLILLDLIEVFLNQRIPPNHITFGKAVAVDPLPVDPTNEDSFVFAEFDPAYDYRFPGVDGFLYRRVDLSALQPGEQLQVIAPEFPFTTHDVLAQINTVLGTALTTDDLINEVFNVGSAELRITASLNAWCWQGNLAVPVVFTGNIPFGSRITEDGFPRITEDGAFLIVDSQ